MDDESRIFWHNREAEPPTSANDKTVLGASVEELSAETAKLSLRELFIKHYGPIRDWLEAHSNRRGIALLAVSPESLRAAAFVAAKSDMLSTAVVGRHSKADLRLGDKDLSLRHVALLLFPTDATGEGCRYRLLDLRSATAFVDERGKRLRALEADGPAFVHLGRYVLFVFVTGANVTPWPADAEEAWRSIPDRLYLDEVETDEKPREWEADSDRAWEAEALPALSQSPTLLHSKAGPEMPVHELLDEDEAAFGEMLVTSRRGAAKVLLGRGAVESGILLGRSRRCDAGRVLSERSISRVHLLIIEIAGVLYAIDTASSNGIFEHDDRERATRLEPGSPVSLSDVARVEWQQR